MSGLNEFQGQHVETTFGHVDRLLTAVEALTQERPSPFTRERPDVSSDEARFLTAFAQQMRTRMISALDRLGLARPVPTLSARNSADVTLRFAEIALADLSSKSLRGFGPVDPGAGAEIDTLAADLRELIERGRALFREQENGGLAERVAKVPGTYGEVLRALERFSDAHALASVRPLIASAAERVMAETYDVGVFGRVSAGKSSLINALIGADVLPVGATPVTAVPLRLRHGVLGAIVRFDAKPAITIPSAEIKDYASEAHNPSNAKRVQSIDITVPTVPAGMQFLDTPGVGSLSASGAAQSFAWLPRCDLGLVLIAAGSAVGTDDLALISGLVHAGIECRVLISKCDLLRADELDESIAYVRRELATVVGGAIDFAIEPVSTAPQGIAFFQTFRTSVLDPLAERHVRALDDALRTRLHRLVALTSSALAERDAAGILSVRQVDGDGMERAHTNAIQRQVRRQAALATIRSETDRLASRTDSIVEAAAASVANAWSAKGTASVATAAARATIIAEAGAALDATRRAIDGSIQQVKGSGASKDTETVIQRRMPPVFDAAVLNELPDLTPPRFLAASRSMIAERRLADIRTPLRADLEKYAARLYVWGEQALSENSSDNSPSTAARDATPSPAGAELRSIDAMVDAPRA